MAVDYRMAWLKGPGTGIETAEAQIVPPPERAYRMVLLGAPGVGKGTQAEFLCERLKANHLSTGDVFRAALSMANGDLSPAMETALAFMKKGALVPDDTVIDMVRERTLCLKSEYGFLLDGFPRTVQQAEALDEMLTANNLKLDAVLNYDLPMDQVIARLSGRRTCRGCKTTFHIVSKPPQVEGVCDKCGGELYQREDDQPESIRVRLQAYNDSTAPLVNYYQAKGLLKTLSAEGSPEEIFKRTLVALGASC